MQRTIFIDFDGTITKKDTCSAMVEAFAREGWQEINRLWEQKELSTEECANKTFELFDADLDDLKKLLNSIEIDDYFIPFLALCKKRGDKVYILSDGYDLNIQTILDKYNIEVPYFCNRLIYTDRFTIQCPHINPDCGTCGTCKTTLMKQLTEPGSQTIYIGDGYSDTCPATHADIIYAKGSLYAFCMENGINAIPYESFKDIIG